MPGARPISVSIRTTAETAARLRRLREDERRIAEAAAPPYTPRDWYCDRKTCNGQPHDGMGKHARSSQRPPDDWPRTIFWRGGRGGGKTRCASNALATLIVDHWDEAREWAVVAPTAGDARTVCMESIESGLLVALGAKVVSGGTLLDNGPYIASYSKTTATPPSTRSALSLARLRMPHLRDHKWRPAASLVPRTSSRHLITSMNASPRSSRRRQHHLQGPRFFSTSERFIRAEELIELEPPGYEAADAKLA